MKYLLTRRLNQDCLENLFAKLRNKFGNCDHPTVYNFTKGLKSVLINDLLQGPSFLSSNCEADESQFLDLSSTWESDSPLTPESESDSETEDLVVNDIPVAEMNALVYVVGWTCCKFLKNHSCQYCKSHLLDENKKFDRHQFKIFTFFKAESSSASAFGGLSVPNENVIKHFSEVEAVLSSTLERALLGKRVSQVLLSKLTNHYFINPLPLCSSHLTKSIHLICTRLKIFYTLKWRNKATPKRTNRVNRKIKKL